MAKHQINPFVFGSETTARFILLILAGLLIANKMGAVIASHENLVQNLSSFPRWDTRTIEGIDQTVSNELLVLRQSVINLAVPGVSIILVFALAGIYYWVYPMYLRWSKRLKKIETIKDNYLLATVKELEESQNIKVMPAFEIETSSRYGEAQAFGSRKPYSLLLSNRLRLLVRQSQESFKAIVLHELAHIVNGDIFPTYFSNGVWISTLLFTMLPCLIYAALNFSWFRFIILTAQIGVALLLVTAIRSSLLRTRELYADQRVKLWEASLILENILSKSGFKRAFVRHPWRLHPTSEERLAALENPTVLFNIKSELAFFVGVLLALVFDQFFNIIANITHILGSGFSVLAVLPIKVIIQLSPPTSIQTEILLLGMSLTSIIFTILFSLGPVILLFLAIVGVGKLMVETLGIEIKLQTVSNIINNKHGVMTYLRLLRPSFIAALGYLIGILFNPDTSYIYSFFPFSISMVSGELFPSLPIRTTTLWLSAAFVLFIWLWMIYIQFSFKEAIISSTNKTRSIKKKFGIIPSVLGGIFMSPMIYGNRAIGSIITSSPLSQEQLAFFQGTFKFALILYGVFMLIVWIISMIRHSFEKPRCQNCGRRVQIGFAVGKPCPNCGYELENCFLYEQ